MISRILAVATLLLAPVLVAGCDESDAASLRVKLNEQGPGGRVAMSVLSAPGAPGAAEGQATSVSWSGRAAVTLSRGDFADVNALTFAEVTFKLTSTGSQNILEVFLPRGPGVKWPTLLASANEDERARARTILAPDDKDSKLGALVKVTIEAPRKITGSDSSVTARGLSAGMDQREATLVLPLSATLQEGPPIRWTVKWD